MNTKEKIIISCIVVIISGICIGLTNSKNGNLKSNDENYVYQSNHNKSKIGMKITKLKGKYNTYEEFSSRSKKKVFLRHKVENGEIISTELGFEYKGRVYYLMGADHGDAYEKNKQVLREAFGKNNCEIRDELQTNDESYSCFGPDGYSSAFATNYGGAGANIEDDWNCYITGDDILTDSIAYCYLEGEDE